MLMSHRRDPPGVWSYHQGPLTLNKHSKRPCPRQGPGSWGGASVLPGPAQQTGWAGKQETGWLPFVPLTPSLHLFSPGTMHLHTWFSFLRAESQCRNAQCAIIPLPALSAASSLWRRPHDLDDSGASPLPPFSFSQTCGALGPCHPDLGLHKI